MEERGKIDRWRSAPTKISKNPSKPDAERPRLLREDPGAAEDSAKQILADGHAGGAASTAGEPIGSPCCMIAA